MTERAVTLSDIANSMLLKEIQEIIASSATRIPFAKLLEGNAKWEFKTGKVAGMSFLGDLFQQRERRAADAIMGIDEAQKVERLEPDLAVEYARLAPLVSEAYVFLKVGETDAALKALQAAQEVVQTVSSPFFSSLMIKSKEVRE